ncbi:hypothetical protein EYF80_052005 [Liparis tanakae]|uniref:Uncharacterized protein n=1 Tax=Liparis tanakae TaxID=230148 RepID=A0A4Z2FAK3_9TELE|nr:hypothetical protein EYF80_052005 [Liparis tanakae]
MDSSLEPLAAYPSGERAPVGSSFVPEQQKHAGRAGVISQRLSAANGDTGGSLPRLHPRMRTLSRLAIGLKFQSGRGLVEGSMFSAVLLALGCVLQRNLVTTEGHHGTNRHVLYAVHMDGGAAAAGALAERHGLEFIQRTDKKPPTAMPDLKYSEDEDNSMKSLVPLDGI